MSDLDGQEREALPEMYSDENGEYFWISADGRTRDEAIEFLYQQTEIRVDPRQVTEIIGLDHKHKRTGEPWFTPRIGHKRFWELVND